MNRKQHKNIQFYKFILFGFLLGGLSGLLQGTSRALMGDLCYGVVISEYSKGLGVSVLSCDAGISVSGVVYVYCEGNGCPGMYTKVRMQLNKSGFGPFIANGKIIEHWGLELDAGISAIYYGIMGRGASYRDRFYSKLRMFSSPDVSGLGVSILFGETGLTDDFKSGVRNLGLLHIIAISGINIVYLQKLVGAVTGRLRKDITSKIDLLLLLVLYVLVGNNISLIRAIGVTLLKTILRKAGIEYRAEYFLFVLSLMVVLSPSVIQNISFWLVFAVCVGIYIISPAVRRSVKISNNFLLLIIESSVVWLSVFPVIILVFKRVAPMSILYGLILDPVLEAATMVGYMAFFIGDIPILGELTLQIYSVLLSLIVNLLYLFHVTT